MAVGSCLVAMVIEHVFYTCAFGRFSVCVNIVFCA